MAEDANQNQEPPEKDESKLLKERSRIGAELDKVVAEKIETLSQIRDNVGDSGGMEKEIDSIKIDEKRIDEEITKTREEIKETTAEIKKLLEEAKKKERDRDLKGLEETENRRIGVHQHKTEMLKQLAAKEGELDEITTRKKGILDKLTIVIEKRAELEEKLDDIDKGEIELRERKLEIESKIGDEIGDLTREIYSIDEEEEVLEEEKPLEEPEEEEKKEEKDKSIDKMLQAFDKKITPQPKKAADKRSILGIFGKSEEKEKKVKPDKNIEQLQKVLPVMDDLLGKLPEDSLEKFANSGDYKIYSELYDNVRGYEGTKEQKKFIIGNAKKVLAIIDGLLENLPDDAIEEFSSSDDFKEYNKLLDMFGI